VLAESRLWPVLRKYSMSARVTRGAAFAALWRDSMIVSVRIILRLLADLVGLVILSFRPRGSVEAENLFLRRRSTHA
jgi:hypothetical protein